MKRKQTLKTLSVDEIKARINSFGKGTMRHVLFIVGAPIELADGALAYVTEDIPCQFGTSYDKIPYVKLRQKVDDATTLEAITEASDFYKSIKRKHLVPDITLKKLTDKLADARAGNPIYQGFKLKKTSSPIPFSDCPALAVANNGNVLLRFPYCPTNCIKRTKQGFEFYELGITFHFFIREKTGEVKEVIYDPKNPRDKVLIDAIKAKAKMLAGKKPISHKPSYYYAVSAASVIDIW